MSTEQSPATRRRIVGLDTMRAVAVLLVVAYHLFVPGLAGGFLGVTVFFTVSGYLITRLLLDEAQATGSINLVAFWRRRVRRLLPVALLATAAVLVWAELTASEQLTSVRPGGLAASTWVYNWWQIAHHVSYFGSFDLPSPLTHYWSLSIEEQFYLLWPVALVGLLALLRPRRLLALLVVLVLAATVWTGVLYGAGEQNRAYLGTDTRAGELLLGAAVAIAMHLPATRQLLDHERWSRVRRHLATSRGSRVLAVSALLGLGVCVVAAGAHPSFPYRGGLLLTAAASAVLILALQAPGLAGWAGRRDAGIAGWLGRRSYSIYVWHYPVVIACSSAATYGRFSVGRSILVLVLTLALATASYRWLEVPIRRRGLRASGSALIARLRHTGPRLGTGLGLVGGLAALTLVAAVVGVRAPHPEQQTAQLRMGQAPRPAPVRPVGHHPSDSGRTSSPTSPTAPSSPAAPNSPTSPTSHPASPWLSSGAAGSSGSDHRGGGAVGRPASGHPAARTPLGAPMLPRRTVAIGDSLMIDIAAALRARLPGVTIDAEVGRQPSDGLQIANSYGQFDRPGGTYILGIGTNGAIDEGALQAFCRSHRAARILLITPRVNRPWEQTSIDAIDDVAGDPNVRVVDFHDAAAGHGDWFGSDGVHLTPPGVTAMVGQIMAVGDRGSDAGA